MQNDCDISKKTKTKTKNLWANVLGINMAVLHATNGKSMPPHNRAAQRQSVRSSRSETTDFTFDDGGDAIADGDQRSTLIRRDVTFSE